MKTAIVIGATGLVGTELVRILLDDNRFYRILVFTRRSLAIKNRKLEERLIDFDKPDSWHRMVKGDVLFSTLGTTIGKAGSKENQYKIDHTYQFLFAQAAAANEVPVYVLISSSGAKPSSMIFYSRMKGELERDIKQLGFVSTNILQPGLLTGNRKEERRGEKIGFTVLNALNSIGLLKRYRPIPAATVARAMVNAGVASSRGVHVHELDGVFKLAEKNQN